MARKFKDFIVRDQPKKRGPGQHKKSKSKSEKLQQKNTRYKGGGRWEAYLKS